MREGWNWNRGWGRSWWGRLLFLRFFRATGGELLIALAASVVAGDAPDQVDDEEGGEEQNNRQPCHCQPHLFFSFYIFDLFCIISLFFFCSFHLARLQPSSLFTTWKLEIYILANHLLKNGPFTVCVTFHIIISTAFNFRVFPVIWSI